MGGGEQPRTISMENLMEWELVAETPDRRPLSSAASTTSDSAAHDASVLEYLSKLDLDILTKSEGSSSVPNSQGFPEAERRAQPMPQSNPPLNPVSQLDVHSSLSPSGAQNSLVESQLSSSNAKQSEQSQSKQDAEPLEQTGLAEAPMTEDPESLDNAQVSDNVLEEGGLDNARVSDNPAEEVSKEEDDGATAVILRKVTELALLQKSLPQANEQTLAAYELLMKLEEAVGGPWEGTPSVEEVLKGEDKEPAEALKALDGFFSKVTAALRLREVHVHLTQAEEKARERRKKRMQFLGTMGGMSALLFVGAGAAVLAAEASLASAYTAYNIFFNPTAITAASAAVEAASGVASLCGLGAVLPGATAASLGVWDLLKAHSRPIKVGQVARLKMLDCMLGMLTEGSGAPYVPLEDVDILKVRVLAKWQQLGFGALSKTDIMTKLMAERAGRCAHVCGVASTNLTSASVESLVRHARFLDLVDQLEVLVWNTCFVAVIGSQNAGKSTLIKAMATGLGRTDVGVSDIGIKSHTKNVGAYQLKDTLWILDCPGSDSISEELADAWTRFRSLPSFFVLVLHYGNGITRTVADLYQQVRARFPDTKILTLVNQVDRYWDELEEDGVDDSLAHVVKVLERAVGEPVDVRFSVLNDKKFDYSMLDKGVFSSDGACQRIVLMAEEMSRAFADD